MCILLYKQCMIKIIQLSFIIFIYRRVEINKANEDKFNFHLCNINSFGNASVNIAFAIRNKNYYSKNISMH